ncbi:MAG: pyridoxamine 5'-phosphate oxidase family protein [Clostridia bacterium]|nr:pyridoxamine 5'-phosphate oxidase family protein [Clostridia bacterium]
MFREMRRKDRKLEKSEAVEILKNGEYGILSTAGQDGYPYGVPVNYVYVNGSIYFHCAVIGHKLDNIRNNDKVSFCVVGPTQILPDKFSTKYESVIVFGRAVEVFDDEKNMALFEFINKYSSDYPEQGKEFLNKKYKATIVIKINVEHISGKARR